MDYSRQIQEMVKASAMVDSGEIDLGEQEPRMQKAKGIAQRRPSPIVERKKNPGETTLKYFREVKKMEPPMPNPSRPANFKGKAKQVFDGLVSRGLPEHVAAGFVMNFQDESGLVHNIEEKEANVHGTRGKGLYQLTGARREQYEATFGDDWSVDNQLDFLVNELATSEKGAAEKIFATTTSGEAGAAIVNHFLRPAEEHRVSRANKYQGIVSRRIK